MRMDTLQTGCSPKPAGLFALASFLTIVFAMCLSEGFCATLKPLPPEVIDKGDIVAVNFAARTVDGLLIQTTWPEVDRSAAGKRARWSTMPLVEGPVEISAGEAGTLPGIGEAVIGMRAGEKRTIEIAAEKAFGLPDPKKMMQLPCERRMSKTIRMQPDQYVNALNAFPVVGKEVNLVPYFKARVLEVTEQYVALEFLAREEQVQDAFGTTDIRLAGEEIKLKMYPKIGSPFEVQQKSGTITMTDGESFTVDFNHPMAGKPMMLDIQIVSLTNAAHFTDVKIPWAEDYDQGLKAAESQKKNTLLVLYADWCSWSKKLLTESLEDPRIKQMKDKFVWVKVDSDKEPAYHDAYQQNGFPMVVVLNAKGDVVKKIDGYRDAAALKKEMDEVLGIGAKGLRDEKIGSEGPRVQGAKGKKG